MILACAMSRATTSGPVSDSRVFTGCCDELGEDLGHRPVQVDLHDVVVVEVLRRVVSGRYFAGSVSSCSRKTPSAVILPSACRSAEQDTAIATGHEAPCRGSRTTRTSWQKYLPPNCAPIPKRLGQLEDLLLELEVAEPVRGQGSLGRQVVEVVRRGVLRGLQRELRRRCRRSPRPGGTAGTRPCRASGSSRRGTPASAWGSGPPSSPGRGTTCSPSRRPWP